MERKTLTYKGHEILLLIIVDKAAWFCKINDKEYGTYIKNDGINNDNEETFGVLYDHAVRTIDGILNNNTKK